MIEEKRILVIDDEQIMRNILKSNLEDNGYIVEQAENARSGLGLAISFHPHLIILDLGLPDQNGYDVLKELRTWTQIPVIILTVNDDEKIKVRLLDAGADDFLTKPFGTAELMARIRVCLRHHGLVEATPVFSSSDLLIDLNQRKVLRDQSEVKLTHTEFEVLAMLVRDHGKVVPQNKIMKKVWGSVAEDETHYLRIYIKQLRKKLEKTPAEPRHILTEPGVGYRLV